jgi:hypothetical protein
MREGCVASSSTCPVYVARDLSASFLFCPGAWPGTERPRWKRVMRLGFNVVADEDIGLF